ncbi:efflux RND transporter periplasmic adaptor subunit [Variovorax dokdonensis]|uniref:Efflux RND transporter periplasmic adaptor subunit n=1 Tax=Variovorax dokdonensis TaxID=344883 RepID=A0ABT7NHB7_9BURK|nr:efflux RND transporter periplasmic adaptor subunit [Variovorax dokdonensis]MDM0047318.1 efflux RND transporter periplasmic adaptor subunit [Variovorax dokdonensis]
MNTPESDAPPAPLRRPLRWVLIAAGVALLVFIAVGLWLAYKPAPLQFQGMVDAEEYTVATQVPISRVERLLVKAGDHVKAGQDLVILRSPELDARREQAAGALAGAQAVQARTLAGSRQENIDTLRAAASSAQAALKLAEQTYRRTRNLHQEGVVSTQRLDEALAARDAAAGQVKAAQEQVLRATRGLPQEDKDAAAAQVEVAAAGLKAVEALQKETRLKAPADGEVGHTMVQPGEVVALGFPILTLVAVDEPWVSLNVRENQLHGLSAGRELVGHLPALDGKAVRFKVRSIGVQGEFATWRATRQSSGFDVRSFEVRLTPAEPVPQLRPGMSVLFDWPQS